MKAALADACRLLRFAVLRVPGVDLLARGLGLVIADPLHHDVDTGMLRGLTERTEGRFPGADDDPRADGSGWKSTGAEAAAVEPAASGCRLSDR